MNPLFLPPIAVGIAGTLLNLPTTVLWTTIGIALFFYTLLPLGGALYLLYTRQIHSLDLPEQKSRTKLFSLSLLSASLPVLLFGLTIHYTHPLIAGLSLIFLVNATVGLMINFRWKMSIHTAALTTMAALFLHFSTYQDASKVVSMDVLSLSILLLLLPLMIWARYRLKIHSLAELIGGAIAGFLLTIIELSLLLTMLW